MAHQLAVAQNHLFWNTAKKGISEMENRQSSFQKGHCHIKVPECQSVRRRGKAYSERYPPTTGCAIVDIGIVKWPCSHMRFH